MLQTSTGTARRLTSASITPWLKPFRVKYQVLKMVPKALLVPFYLYCIYSCSVLPASPNAPHHHFRSGPSLFLWSCLHCLSSTHNTQTDPHLGSIYLSSTNQHWYNCLQEAFPDPPTSKCARYSPKSFLKPFPFSFQILTTPNLPPWVQLTRPFSVVPLHATGGAW